MQKSTQIWYGAAAGLLVVAALAGYVLAQRNNSAPAANSTASSTVATKTEAAGAAGQGITTSIPEPDLSRPYTPPADLPASVQATDKKAVSDAVAQLKIDPNHIAYWLQLAVYRKGANDYTGAEEIWLYCVARWPTDPTAYNNLADLYGNYTHNYPSAVSYWNKLIALQPSNITAYTNLATLYDINMHDSADAKATLEAGLKANPGSPDLTNALKALQ